jgi:hypothetical protein
MSDNKEFKDLSLEELVAKQKSLTNWKKIFASIAVISVLMTLYAVYKDTIGKHVFFILGSLMLIAMNSNRLKKVEEEIKNRKD